MASIKKQPNGTFRARVFVGRDAGGKQLFESITRDSEKECKAAARELEQEVSEGRYTNLVKMRFAAWVDKWMELNKERLSPSTFCSYKIYVDAHYKPYFKNLKMGQITDLHIKQYINDKLKTLSPTTVRKHVWVLNRIMEDALKGKNPVRGVKMPPPADYKPHVVTGAEFQTIHDAVKGSIRNEIIILLSGWCGMRRGEIFALKRNDIIWGKNLIRVDESRCISEEGYVDKKTKSKKGNRVVAVPEYLMDLLGEYIKAQAKKTEEIPERIFDIDPASCTDWFSRLADNLQMPDVRFHDLRHYHASWMYEQNIPDQYAADRLGHDVHVLKSIYQHLGLDRKLEIDEQIKNNPPSK
jgi:integrase